MSTNLFSAPSAALVGATVDSTTPSIATIKIGREVVRLPVISIKDLSHRVRKQTTCSLSGDINIIYAQEGLASCTITCIEVLDKCNGTAQAESAMAKYKQLKKHDPTESKVVITLLDAKVTFTGYVDQCTASAMFAKDIPYIIVTLTLTGKWA